MRFLEYCLFLASTLASLAIAATDADALDAQANERKYAEKLEKEFVSKIEWRQSLEKAKAEATREGRLIFGYFTRSYAPCPPCNALEGGPLIADWWVAASSDVVPYLNVTAQWDGAPDQGLMTPLGGLGFPYCVLLDAAGAVVWEVRPESEDVWTRALAGARRLDTVRTELEADDLAESERASKRATATLLDAIGRIQRPWPSIDSLDAAAAVAGVPDDIRAWYSSERTTQLIRRSTQARDGGRSALQLYRDGKRPDPAQQGLPFSFYRAALEGAITTGDATIGYELLENFGTSMTDPQYKGWMRKQVNDYRERLDAIAAGSSDESFE